MYWTRLNISTFIEPMTKINTIRYVSMFVKESFEIGTLRLGMPIALSCIILID